MCFALSENWMEGVWGLGEKNSNEYQTNTLPQ